MQKSEFASEGSNIVLSWNSGTGQQVEHGTSFTSLTWFNLTDSTVPKGKKDVNPTKRNTNRYELPDLPGVVLFATVSPKKLRKLGAAREKARQRRLEKQYEQNLKREAERALPRKAKFDHSNSVTHFSVKGYSYPAVGDKRFVWEETPVYTRYNRRSSSGVDRTIYADLPIGYSGASSNSAEAVGLIANNNVLRQWMNGRMQGMQLNPAMLQYYLWKFAPKAEDFLPVTNLVTFFLEFKDVLGFVRQTRDLIKRCAKAVDSSAALMRGKSSGIRAKLQRGVAVPEAIANANLWWSFGVAPTTNDLAGFFALASFIGDFVSWYNKTVSGHVYCIHRSIAGGSISESHVDDNFMSPHYTIVTPPVEGIEKTITEKQILFGWEKSKLTWRIRLEPLPSTFSRELQAHVLGMDQIISGIWDGLPWSWAVDYFLNVGDVIEDHLNNKLFFPWSIVDACWSRKVSVECKLATKVKFSAPSVYANSTEYYFDYQDYTYKKAFGVGDLLLKASKAETEISANLIGKAYQRSIVTSYVKDIFELKNLNYQDLKFAPKWKKIATNGLSVGLLNRDKFKRQAKDIFKKGLRAKTQKTYCDSLNENVANAVREAPFSVADSGTIYEKVYGKKPVMSFSQLKDVKSVSKGTRGAKYLK